MRRTSFASLGLLALSLGLCVSACTVPATGIPALVGGTAGFDTRVTSGKGRTSGQVSTQSASSSDRTSTPSAGVTSEQRTSRDVPGTTGVTSSKQPGATSSTGEDPFGMTFGTCPELSEVATYRPVPSQVLASSAGSLAAQDLKTGVIRIKSQYEKLVATGAFELPAWEDLPYPNVVVLAHDDGILGGCGLDMYEPSVLSTGSKIHVEWSYRLGMRSPVDPDCSRGASCSVAFAPVYVVTFDDRFRIQPTVCERAGSDCPRT